MVRAGNLAFFSLFLTLGLAACTSLPKPRYTAYRFPQEAFVGEVRRAHQVIGRVRSKFEYNSLDPSHEDPQLCRNFYNRAVVDLLRRAKERGADAIIDVRSVVFMEDGKM